MKRKERATEVCEGGEESYLVSAGTSERTIMVAGTTMEDRRKELEALLRQFAEHPERDWSAERERARTLSEMLAHHGGKAS